MTPFDKTVSMITPKSTSVFGLKFFPCLGTLNNKDDCLFEWPPGPEVTDDNIRVVNQVIARLGNRCRAILEIGVHRNNNDSITTILMDKKPKGCFYLGIDLNDKSYLDNPFQNLHTIKCNSHDQFLIRQKLISSGITEIDLLMIDGWHSVNTCVNDWMYADLLSKHGSVILHDTNAHPGPIALYHAIDEKLFQKQRFNTDHVRDMGISVINSLD